MSRKCTGKTAAGKRCRAPAVGGTKPARCIAHATGEAAQRRAEGCRRGGKSRMKQIARGETERKPLRLASQADVVHAAARVANEVWNGELDPRSANAIVGCLQAVLRPGLLEPTSQFDAFFAQFKDIVMEVDRGDPDAHGCYGVLPDGTKVLLAGELEAAAVQMLMAGGKRSIRVEGGAAVRPDADAVECEFDGIGPEEQPQPPKLVLRRSRNPKVPPPEDPAKH